MTAPVRIYCVGAQIPLDMAWLWIIVLISGGATQIQIQSIIIAAGCNIMRAHVCKSLNPVYCRDPGTHMCVNLLTTYRHKVVYLCHYRIVRDLIRPIITISIKGKHPFFYAGGEVTPAENSCDAASPGRL